MQGRALTQPTRIEVDDDDLDIAHLQSVSGGDSRSGQLTGTKALMLAVLEDGIRSYLRGSGLAARDADFWIHSQRRHSPFSFIVVCEILGLSPEAVRETLKRLRADAAARKMIPRARHNVRIPGKVYARRG